MSVEPHIHGEAPFESTQRQKRLRILPCRQCETYEGEIREAANMIRNLEVDLRAKRRKISELEGQVRRDLLTNPDHARAEELFDFWVQATGRNPKRTIWGEKRQKAVLRAVQLVSTTWADKDDPDLPWRVLACAVVGAAREGMKKYDELALIVKDEKMIEMHLDNYRSWCVKNGKEPKV